VDAVPDHVQNIEADSRVRVGTAHILDDGDAEERARILSRGNRGRGLCPQASTSIGASPLTVRIDLDAITRR
jgi:hypothetical protein